MSKAQVAIAKNGDPSEMAKSALKLAGIDELCRGKEVLIKVNLSGGPADQKGAIVSRETAKGVFEYLKPFCKRLVLGDGAGFSAERTKEVLETRTFAKSLGDELGIEVMNLWDSDTVTVKVPKPMARSEWKVSKAALDFEVLGTLPVLKINRFATVTLGMKNLFSLLGHPPLNRFHPWLQEVIVDVNQILRPAFNVIDGYWGWEAGESSLRKGHAVQANLIIAGKDVVATDAIAALAIGLDPLQIKKFRIAQEAGLGVADPKDIEILGVPLEKARHVFEPMPEEMKMVFPQETIAAGIESVMDQ